LNSIAFIDTEIDPQNEKILDVGGVKDDGNIFHKASIIAFVEFLKGTRFVCGHNIFNHDIKYIGSSLDQSGIHPDDIIDTLCLSPLLFPLKPYHALLKDDKLQYEEANNPLNDAKKAKDLFFDEIAAFNQMDDRLKEIYFLLLNTDPLFKGFFRFLNFSSPEANVVKIISEVFKDEICEEASLGQIISDNPVELSYCLSLINTGDHYSITPPWVLKNYPDVERIMYLLRNKPCVSGCIYCNKALNAQLGLKRFFGFDGFRSYGGEPLQEKAVKAAIDNKSFLAVFPTGGGKSITFQVPALMSGECTRGLTVVISPLQSLMKDQVDNLEKTGITNAVTINGLLDPIERAKSFERVEDGSASILYISPESLRSKTIENLFLGRKIARFVIDEAHCFSSWGQNFRVDYLYIGDFIRALQDKKNLAEHIPVSCFTATAKPQVIEDICTYFNEKLGLKLELITSNASRTNLHYKVFAKESDDEKYFATRDLIEQKNCPTIVYVSRTSKAVSLAKRLSDDGLNAKPFHGKMDANDKIANQNAFLAGEVKIMVATSAFGMGVDKKDVGMVIHYDISDSLENYVQEAGRAGRDESIIADCYVLFNEEDLSKHFIMLNQTKLSIKEIQQIWKAIKELTRFRSKVSNSALEIARKAGWDDSVSEIETRVTTAIAALEDAGYLKRGQNSPRIFANSILAKSAHEAVDKINASERFTEKQKVNAIRIIKKLFSSKRRKEAHDEAAESRVDYISDHLGIVKEEVINIITLLREEKILADVKDLTAFIKQGENKNRSLDIVETFAKIEKHLLPYLEQKPKTFHIKELNESIETHASDVTPNKIKTIINFWAIKNWIKRQKSIDSKYHFEAYSLQPRDILNEKLEKRVELAKFVTGFLFDKTKEYTQSAITSAEILVEFSVHELKEAYQQSSNLFKLNVDVEDIEDALFYLSKIEAIKIEGGFLVVYNRLTIERKEQDNKRRYKAEDYQKLGRFYENKIQQIHIVGEYAQKMIENYLEALQFVDDYFQLNYSSFLNKYFKGSRQKEISRNITPTKFREIFGELSPAQLKIVNDTGSKYIVVAAGPGSGKTRVLVHKLASLLLMEDVKHEQLLMLTFSRAAATEFKKRLIALIGNVANFIEIKTFHSYCFDLLGKIGSLNESESIIQKAIEKIRNKDLEINRITKTVLVIDEAQDINQDEFSLIKALIDINEDMRVIAVGDDDQNIYSFRGSDSKYLQQLIQINGAIKYELVENYRSKSNLVNFSNMFVSSIPHRLKDTPIVAQQTASGKIKIIRYQNNNLVVPLVDNILNSSLSGTTCILTKTNEDALKITGLLLNNNMPAKLIQTNDTFDLYNLCEIRFLLDLVDIKNNMYPTIDNDKWDEAKCTITAKFRKSSNWEICNNMIRDFEVTNNKTKYKSDLEVFIHESKLEDFYTPGTDIIFVSTIHKAKGKEFDNVFLMLENMYEVTEEASRQLYVAITRAKQNLTIHLNTNHFSYISIEGMEIIMDREVYLPPTQLTMYLTHKDVWLNHFSWTQKQLLDLMAGDKLVVKNDECFNQGGQSVLKFAKSFQQKLETLAARGFKLMSAKVNFIVWWYKEDTQQELLVVLPKLYFEKI
jgi:ATP-dependent DNA helicase RecQ